MSGNEITILGTVVGIVGGVYAVYTGIQNSKMQQQQVQHARQQWEEEKVKKIVKEVLNGDGQQIIRNIADKEYYERKGNDK